MSLLGRVGRRLVPARSFARNVVVLAGGTAAGQGLVVISAPVLTRLYSPEDFGIFGVYGALVGIMATFTALRYELAIPLPEDEETANDLAVLALLIVGAVSVMVFGAVSLWGDRVAERLGTPALGPFLWMLPLSIAFAGCSQVLVYWSVRQGTFGDVARGKLSQGLGQVLGSVGLGILESGPAGLLAGDVAGRMSGTGALGVRAVRDSRLALKAEFRGLAAAASRYRRFPLIASGSALVNTLGLQLPMLLLATLYGSKVAGWYALTQRVIGVPMSLVGSAVAQVYLAEAAKLSRRRRGEVRKMYSATAGRLLLFGGFPILGFGLIAPWLFSWIFGEDWQDAGKYAQVLAATFAAQFVVVPLSQTLNVLQRQEVQLLWDTGRLVLVGACFLLAASVEWSPLGAVTAYAAAMFGGYVTLYMITLMVLRDAAGSDVDGRGVG